MSARARAARDLWRARNVRTIGDRGYLAYMIVMVTVFVAAPVARAVWLSAISAEGIALFAAPAAPGATVFVVALVWAGALLWGRDRGPALLPPFLTYALGTSDLPRSDAFRGPVLRNGALVVVITTTTAGLVSGALVSQNLADPLSAVSFPIIGVMVGIITTIAWLAGQALPRAAVPSALGVIALGAATALLPFLQQFTPWGWAGTTYPGTDSPHSLVALAAMTALVITVAPALLNRLDQASLAAQAARWESATGHAVGMEFAAAAATYQARPHRGRRIRAVQPARRLATVFLIRDAIGAARTPGRLIVGILTLIGAGTLVTFAFMPGTPGWLLGAAAGLLVFAGIGPLTDGLRHAVHVASGFSLYGISDERLLANHLIFPLTVVLPLLATGGVACAASIGLPALTPALSSLALGALALTARVSSALKGPLPSALLAPIPTPMGDLSAATRLMWALDAVLLAALAGASVALMLQAPLLLIGTSAALLIVAVTRWARRD